MTIKTKKILLSSLSILVAGTALAAISCGQRRFDQVERNEVRILSGFSKDKSQYNAVMELIRMYNETEKDKPDFLQVVFDTDEKSYTSVFSRLSQGLESKDSSNLWNLALHYPVSVAQVESYDMRLRFDKNANNKDDYGITRDQISEGFLDFNDRIEGVEKGQISGIPFGKSTIVSSLNAPIWAYTLETMVSFGATIDEKSKAWFEEIKKMGESDKEYIKKLWGAPLETEKSKYKDYVIDKDKILNNGLELINFSILAQDLFANSHNKPTGELHFFGIGDPAGFISTMLYSIVADKKNDYEKHFIRHNQDGTVDYKPFSEKGTPAYNALKEITEALVKASNNGALYTLSRPSTLIKGQKMGISLGSTSSYDEHFSKTSEDKKEVKLLINPDGEKDEKIIKSTLKLVTATNSDFLVNTKEKSDEGILISTSSIADEKLSWSKIKSNDVATDTAIKTFIDGLNGKLNNATILKSSDLDKVWNNPKGKAKLEADGVKRLGQVKIKNRNNIETDYIYGIADFYNSTSKTSFKVTQTKFLSQSGFYVNNSPRKWVPENKINTVYLQGPSLIGIHSNEKGDKATRKFVHWLISNNEFEFKFFNEDTKKYEFKYLNEKNEYKFDTTGESSSKKPVKFRPLRYLFEASSYLSPYSGFFKEVTPTNGFSKDAFDEFTASNGEGWQLLEEPANSLSDYFRNAINGAVKGAVNRRLRGTAKADSNSYEAEIYPAIRTGASTFGVFNAPERIK